jgi:methylenetetrahydrofolate reductase (NADPH)
LHLEWLSDLSHLTTETVLQPTASTILVLVMLESCPKHMTYGPCGGVNPDGTCEVAALPCPFAKGGLMPWQDTQSIRPEVTPSGQVFLEIMQKRPVIVTDLPTAPLSADSIRASADVLAGFADAVLLGDHGDARVQFPPAYRAMLVQQSGLRAWPGLNCRDRNRVALEGELAALVHTNVAGVHCITGDHTACGHRPDAQAVFDLDSTRLASLANAAGLLVSVAESPTVIPRFERPYRLVQKIKAGATICFVNHSGEAENVAAFITSVNRFEVHVPFIAGLAVATSEGSANALRGFRNLVVPQGYLEAILASPNPRKAGIRAAIKFGEGLLSQAGVRGLNLSSAPKAGQELELANDLAEIAKAFL